MGDVKKKMKPKDPTVLDVATMMPLTPLKAKHKEKLASDLTGGKKSKLGKYMKEADKYMTSEQLKKDKKQIKEYFKPTVADTSPTDQEKREAFLLAEAEADVGKRRASMSKGGRKSLIATSPSGTKKQTLGGV